MSKSKNQACPRIYTRCPACHNDTLTITKTGRLLCTWHVCPNPILIDRIGEPSYVWLGERAGDRKPAPPETQGVKALVSARCSAAATEKERSLLLWMQLLVGLIGYQPEFPHSHKQELAEAMTRYEKALDAVEQQNGGN
jgi:hypothetical protein